MGSEYLAGTSGCVAFCVAGMLPVNLLLFISFSGGPESPVSAPHAAEFLAGASAGLSFRAIWNHRRFVVLQRFRLGGEMFLERRGAVHAAEEARPVRRRCD
jgi:hypothetical protein